MQTRMCLADYGVLMEMFFEKVTVSVKIVTSFVNRIECKAKYSV